MLILTKEEQWLFEEKYASQECEAFTRDRARLAAGEPLAYVIGFIDFLGCRIDLSERPLIPRPETEYWTEQVIREAKSRWGSEDSISALDLFSGSGCIGIALLKHLPNVCVDFVDIEPNYLRQIEKNLDTNHIGPSRYRVCASDVFSNVPEGKRYHLITANPPYIDKDMSADRVAPSVRDFEPHQSLFAPENGLAHIRQVLVRAKDFLLPNSRLYLEFDDIQKEKIAALFAEYDYSDFSFHKDQFGKWRYITSCV